MQEDSEEENPVADFNAEQEPDWDYFYEEPSFIEETSASSFIEEENGLGSERIFSSTFCSPSRNLVLNPGLLFDDLEQEVLAVKPSMCSPFNCLHPRRASSEPENQSSYVPQLGEISEESDLEFEEAFQDPTAEGFVIDTMAPPPKPQPTAAEMYTSFLGNVKKWNSKHKDAVHLGDNIFQENVDSLFARFKSSITSQTIKPGLHPRTTMNFQ